MERRRLAPPAAAASASAALPPPSRPPPQLHQAPRALLPLPSAHAPSKKRRVSPSPRKAATTPIPAPSPPPALANSAPDAAFLNPYSLPRAQGSTSTEPAYVDPATAPPPAVDDDGKPSTPSPPAADEEPSSPPAVTRPVLARAARETEMKGIVIRNPVPMGTGTFAAGNAAVGELPLGKNAAFEEVADEEQNARKIEVEELLSGFSAVDVDESLLGFAQKPLLGEEAVGGGTLIGKPVANTDSDACEAEELASTSIGKEEFGMSDRAGRQRRMTELFVCGLGNDMKEEDVRSVFGWAGEITEVRMAMDARTSKSKGYCFVRYHEPSQAKTVVAEFCKLKICWKLCQIEAVDGNDKIVLENIDKKWKKEDIMKLLHKTGVEKIDTVTLMADCDNPGYNCGYAFLELETERDAWMAYIKLSRKGVFSSCLNITVAWAKPMSDLDKKMQQVKSSLLHAQEHAKLYYNIKHTTMAFSIGDWVWVKLLLRPMVSMAFHNKGKLGLRFYGPYQVLERIGEMTYRLQLQAAARIHDVFHVDFLEAFSGTVLATTSSFPPMLHGNMLPVPVSIIRSRLARGQWQVLVRWEGLAASEASWEDVESFRQRYPTFVIEDQLFLKERDVMIGIKYHRRQHG